MPSALYTQLRIAEAREGEVEDILGEHFHSASQSGLNEVLYPGVNEQSYALKVVYAGARIVDVESGSQLTDSDVEVLTARIATESLETVGEKVGELVLFAAVPTTGYFRYEERFEIAPVGPDAPRPGFIMGDHPLLLRYKFTDSRSITIRFGRRFQTGHQLELLLSAIVPFRLHSLGNRGRSHWVLLPNDDPRVFTSAYRQEWYHYEGLRPEGDDFLSQAQGVHELAQTLSDAYYARSGIGVGDVLTLPDSFTHLCDQYFALGPVDHDAFLTATFWLHHAEHIQHYARSAYFTALIGAIEAIMPDPESGTSCTTCGRSLGKGPTAQFSDFVEKFMGDSISVKERRRLYGIRSALSHGGKLLRSDKAAWHAGFNQEIFLEWSDLSTASRLVRAVLLGWLRSRTP